MESSITGVSAGGITAGLDELPPSSVPYNRFGLHKCDIIVNLIIVSSNKIKNPKTNHSNTKYITIRLQTENLILN